MKVLLRMVCTMPRQLALAAILAAGLRFLLALTMHPASWVPMLAAFIMCAGLGWLGPDLQEEARRRLAEMDATGGDET